MKRERRLRKMLARLLRMAPLVLAGGLTTSPARAGGERILAVAENAIYGGATGLLLGGVLTLVVNADNRGDVVRWGVVAGTFVGFGYGLYDARGTKDEFSELVRNRADARRQSRHAEGSEAGIASGRAAATPGGEIPAWRVTSSGSTPNSPRLEVGERPEPAMGRAKGRNSW